LKETRHGKFTKDILILLDNAPAHRALATLKKLTCLGFQYLDQTPYSLDLALSAYHLFPGLKKMKSGHSSSDAEVIAAAEAWLDGKNSVFFEWLEKLELRANKRIDFRGSMLNRLRVWSLQIVSFLVGLRTYQHTLQVSTFIIIIIIIIIIISRKILTSFLYPERILLIGYLPKGQTINADCYLSLLLQVKQFLRKFAAGYPKRVLNCTKNAPAQRAPANQKKLVCLDFQFLDHPTYSPELAPPQLHLFPGV
jgi:hypothetical protein